MALSLSQKNCEELTKLQQYISIHMAVRRTQMCTPLWIDRGHVRVTGLPWTPDQHDTVL